MCGVQPSFAPAHAKPIRWPCAINRIFIEQARQQPMGLVMGLATDIKTGLWFDEVAGPTAGVCRRWKHDTNGRQIHFSSARSTTSSRYSKPTGADSDSVQLDCDREKMINLCCRTENTLSAWTIGRCLTTPVVRVTPQTGRVRTSAESTRSGLRGVRLMIWIQKIL